jgi:hypothetical protein
MAKVKLIDEPGVRELIDASVVKALKAQRRETLAAMKAVTALHVSKAPDKSVVKLIKEHGASVAASVPEVVAA